MLPEVFSGPKHGWEVFWYDNGKVKDSTLYRNDMVIRGGVRSSFFQVRHYYRYLFKRTGF